MSSPGFQSKLVRKVATLLAKAPYLGDVLRERDRLRLENARLRAELDRLWQPPGHFYSPIPDLDDVKARAADLFDTTPRSIPGIDLNETRQLELLEQFCAYYHEQPFTAQKQPGLRYFFENPHYSYSDAIFLYCMIRHLRPRQIIEAGAGYSSCVILDTNEHFCGNQIRSAHIEPYPELLHTLLHPGDANRIEIIARPLQDVSLDRFSALAAGDILFIDSTHVAKIGSDVNYLFFEILPALAPGVYVHIHDILYPFEYPAAWVYEGRAWNEAYLLHAFLQYNPTFSIQFFNTYLEQVHEPWFRQEMPLCLKDPGGSIWLRKEPAA